MSRFFRPAILGLLACACLGAHAAPNCASLKSGDYRLINHREADPDWRHHVMQFDAASLTFTDFTGGTFTLTPAAEKCAYSGDGGNVQLVVSRSGILVVRDATNGAMALGLPEMALDLKALVGLHNFLGAGKQEDGLMHTDAGQISIDRRGRVRSAGCGDGGIGACGPTDKLFATLTPNPAGGFDMAFKDSSYTERLFAFKNRDGLVAVVVGQDQIHVATPALARTLPAVGPLPNNWSLSQNPQGTTSALNFEHREVVSVDAVSQSFVRRSLDSCVQQTWFINQGHAGVTYREKGTGTNCTGQTVNLNAVHALGTGLGFSVFGWESSDPAKARFFGFGIDQP
ncbi:hypothetical protein KAK06_09090 [Ideonella sp. 4Y11]|uniref:Uncharacterized protein n=1 Tax=Ideonella aquatica TaxID=2824119 RepID=A0A941BQH7_9BURK|nr:hypothetical protein [Ideonella aquatica]MBQ0959115.1 hypothetical protein [Ideonella aquatica]